MHCRIAGVEMVMTGCYKCCLVHSLLPLDRGVNMQRRSNCDLHASLSVSVVRKDLAC
eukprot:COSAG06_NODE_67649_length_251_cov_0.756579_1_plen_56_part_01